MNESELLEHVLDRIARSDAGAEIFDAIETRQWPDGALAALTKAGVLRQAQPAQVIECDGCEKNCFKPVHIRPAEQGRAASAFIACDEREDRGRIRVELGKLEQWQVTRESLAGAVGRLIELPTAPRADSSGNRWILGLLAGEKRSDLVVLSIEDSVTLHVAGHTIPLTSVLMLSHKGLSANRDVLIRLADTPQVNFDESSRHARRDAEIRAKYADLARLGRRN